jgi:hypothetical protein
VLLLTLTQRLPDQPPIPMKGDDVEEEAETGSDAEGANAEAKSDDAESSTEDADTKAES